jgi:hypothetical protein
MLHEVLLSNAYLHAQDIIRQSVHPPLSLQAKQEWVDAWIRTMCTQDGEFADDDVMVSAASKNLNRPVVTMGCDNLNGRGVPASVHTPDGIRSFLHWDDLCEAFPPGAERDSLIIILYNGNQGMGGPHSGNHFDSTMRSYYGPTDQGRHQRWTIGG